MSLKDMMNELNFEERKIYGNKDFDTEYFTFNKANAVKALCYLIDNATKTVEIHHKAILNSNKLDNKYIESFKENFNSNPVVQSLKNNKNISITYYTNNIPEEGRNIIKEYINPNVKIIDLNLNKTNNITYHHKEVKIDNEYTIITSINFLTNTSTDGTAHWLENFSIWYKQRSEK